MNKPNQSVIELILQLDNKLKAGFSQANKELDAGVDGMQRKLDDFGKSAGNDLRKANNESKGLIGSLKGMINPATLAAAGITAIATGLVKATNRAAEFNHEFRDLANLNLDKTRNEIDSLRRLTLNSAWRKGFNASETSSAYEEVQSTVGLYGRDATAVVEKQGEFAKVMKANMADYVAGTSKAMANWRFGIDRLDDFNKSAYATMQVGVVSFEELAKVQSVYAGAAASIKQDFDTANKLFSLFTIRTKSVDEAATLTKSLFNDLTKKRTVDAFKNIGINFFDINGQLKQADTILLELNDKFKTLKDDNAIVALKNQFHGSEGLIALIQAATDQSGELKRTLDEFADSKLNMDNAMTLAHEDIIYRQEQLSNRVDNLMIRLGETLLPAKEWIVGGLETIVERTNSFFRSPDEKKEFWKEHEYKSVYDEYGHLVHKVKELTEEEFKELYNSVGEHINKYDAEFDRKSREYANQPFWNYDPISYFKGHETRLAYMDDKTQFTRHSDRYRAQAYKSLQTDLWHAWQDKDKVDESNVVGGDTTTTTNDNKASNSLAESLNRVVGSAQTPRNITVNIEAFNKGGINTQNTSLSKMSADDIENWFIDVCMRAVRNVEMSY